jgi:hypothetical protein
VGAGVALPCAALLSGTRDPSPRCTRLVKAVAVATAVLCVACAASGCAGLDSSSAEAPRVRCQPPSAAELRAGDVDAARAARRAAQVERRERGLIVGIDGGYGGWGFCETMHRAALGAPVTRHEWQLDEGVAVQDEFVYKAAARAHTRLHALLGTNELGDADHYQNFVVAFIRRYGIGGSFWLEHPQLDAQRYAIRTFELGNEPYFGGMSASDYAATVGPVLERVKALGLPARMVLASRVDGIDTSWMDTLYAEIPRLNSLYYAITEHPYWYGHNPAEADDEGPFRRIALLRQRLDELGAGAKPIFITEYGESTADCGEECVSEAVQARHLREMIRFCRRPPLDVQLLLIFQLIDRGTNSGDRELQFGILRQNGSRKPSYPIVQRAISG